jgi:hypothetical protein
VLNPGWAGALRSLVKPERCGSRVGRPSYSPGWASALAQLGQLPPAPAGLSPRRRGALVRPCGQLGWAGKYDSAGL